METGILLILFYWKYKQMESLESHFLKDKFVIETIFIYY